MQHFFGPGKRRGTCFPSRIAENFLQEHARGRPYSADIQPSQEVVSQSCGDLTDSKEKLKEVMVVLDAHSKKVRGTHYILRDPEDDVKLAKALVKACLGDTVAFPSDEQVQEYIAANPSFQECMQKAFDYEAGPKDEVDEADDDLECWSAAKCFGIREPKYEVTELLALADGVVGDGTVVAPVLLPIAAAAQGEAAEQGADHTTTEPAKPAYVHKHERPAFGGEAVVVADAEKAAYYKRYEPPAVVSGGKKRRTTVPAAAHRGIENVVREWQKEYNQGPQEKPYGNNWYWDLRCKMVDDQLLQKSHCWDVCRSYAASYFKFAGAAASSAGGHAKCTRRKNDVD